MTSQTQSKSTPKTSATNTEFVTPGVDISAYRKFIRGLDYYTSIVDWENNFSYLSRKKKFPVSLKNITFRGKNNDIYSKYGQTTLISKI